MKIAVAGGTGLTGRHLVADLRACGHTISVLARSHGVDLVTGVGLNAALAGVEATLDVTSTNSLTEKDSVNFFGTAGTHLLTAAHQAGVSHHIALSIVGVDRVKFGYYQGKRRQEELIRAAPLPWTILRATQFHEFAAQTLAQMRGPLALIPPMRVQPIAVAEVARHLAQLVTQPPQQMAPELAGPRDEYLPDMARRLLHARGSRRLVVPLRLPTAGLRAMANGHLLPQQPGPRGTQSFDEWLTQQ